MIYLDWASTAIPEEELIIEANKKAFNFFANPSSLHLLGKSARAVLENSRQEIAALFKIKPEQLFFTSGGTEANHIPLLSLLNLKKSFSIAISNIEHPSIREQTKILERAGAACTVLKIPADKNGFITADAVLKTIRDDTALVSVMTVNNETGAIQPIKEIGVALKEKTANKKPIFFHTDTVQAIGKIPLDLSLLPIDAASFSAHKIGASRGIGFLYLAKPIAGFIQGGGQENKIRPGTENLAGILAMEAALKKYIHHQDEYIDNAKKLMSFLIAELKKIKEISLVPPCRENPGEEKNFSPWILQFANSTLPGEVLLRCLSDKEICISTGSACSSKKKENNSAQSIQIDPKLVKNINRVSIGHSTTIDDLKEFIKELKTVLSSF